MRGGGGWRIGAWIDRLRGVQTDQKRKEGGSRTAPTKFEWWFGFDVRLNDGWGSEMEGLDSSASLGMTVSGGMTGWGEAFGVTLTPTLFRQGRGGWACGGADWELSLDCGQMGNPSIGGNR